ncbi:hypothetical protein AVEN_240503-1 [Araneus ventricosus]|uniref:Uncharacterized protein n=1 Tax=Araneus ventricosus TaxID=182803 RepID=A0A4Y2IB39_ARAVE|nr:hypothetical protein AVEN_240503-1 [Araneus ventricosus]
MYDLNPLCSNGTFTAAQDIRGHTLLLTALSKIIFSEMNLSSEEQFMDAYLNDLHEATPSFSTVEELRICNDVKTKYQNKCFQLKERYPISKLCVQYLDMVLILKEFIRTERMGGIFVSNKEDDSVFPRHRTSFCMPKSDQLFVQEMENLGNTVDADTFKKFTVDFFTVM